MPLIYDGKSIPCEAPVVFRPKGRKFQLAMGGVYRRRTPPRLLVAHWNGSERGPEAMYSTLRQRGLSVEFAMDHEGNIEQWADPARVFCSHARGVNAHAIGIEIQNPGSYTWTRPDGRPLWSTRTLERMKRKVGRGAYRDTVNGDSRPYLFYTPEQLDSFFALAEAFAKAGVIQRRVPRRIDVLTHELDALDAKGRADGLSPDEVVRREQLEVWLCELQDAVDVCGGPNHVARNKLPDGMLERFTGVCGHYHVSATKTDPGPDILEGLAEFWEE
jgi:hypothetical protein